MKITWSSGRTAAALLGGAALVLAASVAPAPAVEYVDLELVMATDVSQSIDEDEALLQREGTAAAFRNAEVIRAIRSGVLRRIAVAYIDYSSRAYNRVVIDWRIIGDRASAAAFSDALLKAPLSYGRRTSISDGIEFAREMIEGNQIEGTRRAIDVSGDGPNNWGRLVDQVRDETAARNITINGLPIVNNRGFPGSRYWLPDLDQYYRGCVIGGPGAFYVVARDFRDFARAIRRKLILEIAARPPAAVPRFIPASTLAQAVPQRTTRTGYVYPRGCDIGERMRQSYWGDTDNP